MCRLKVRCGRAFGIAAVCRNCTARRTSGVTSTDRLEKRGDCKNYKEQGARLVPHYQLCTAK